MRLPSRATAGLLMALASLARAEDPTDPTADHFDALHVAGDVYALRTNTAVTNTNVCACIGDDGVLLVDASFPRLGPVLAAALDSLGGSDVRFVVNTHPHWDHAWGNEFWGGAGAVIVAHPFARDFLDREQLPDDSGNALSRRGLPTLTSDASMTLHLAGETVEIAPMPRGGHTGGDTVVYFREAGVLCPGDYYFADRYPIIDVEAGGSLEGYLANASRLVQTYPADTFVVPGHDNFPPDAPRRHTMAEYRAWVATLERSVAHVRARERAGQSLEQITAEGLPPEFAPLAARPRFVSEARWIETVFIGIQ